MAVSGQWLRGLVRGMGRRAKAPPPRPTPEANIELWKPPPTPPPSKKNLRRKKKPEPEPKKAELYADTKEAIAEGHRGTTKDLARLLVELDGTPYEAYQEIQGSWKSAISVLHIDDIQRDPSDAPSKCRLTVSHEGARLPPNLFSSPIRKTALCDYLNRRMGDRLSNLTRSLDSSSFWRSAQGGEITLDRPGAQVLARSAVVPTADAIDVRLTVNLPAQLGTVLGKQSGRILERKLGTLERSITYFELDLAHLQRYVDNVDDQEELRGLAGDAGLAAFVRDGAVLPRIKAKTDSNVAQKESNMALGETGAPQESHRPREAPATPQEDPATPPKDSDSPADGPAPVPFQSPPSLQRSFKLSHCENITGMGIPEGVTVIVGQDEEAKTTLLHALSMGCYNHTLDDGREFVVASPNVVLIESEPGRAIHNVDISPFTSCLSGRYARKSTSFNTESASASESLAAGIVEALELGADTLLLDEQTLPEDFVICGRGEQDSSRAVFTFDPQALFRECGCSTILLSRGRDDYSGLADVVLEMRDGQCHDITTVTRRTTPDTFSTDTSVPSFPPPAARHVRLSALPTSPQTPALAVLDLRVLPQLVDASQADAVALALTRLWRIAPAPGADTLALRALPQLWADAMRAQGLDALVSPGDVKPFLAMPRALEIGMALNRLRIPNMIVQSGSKTWSVQR